MNPKQSALEFRLLVGAIKSLGAKPRQPKKMLPTTAAAALVILHRPPCARWPGTLGSWLAGHCLWPLVWTGACYWHGADGFVFN